MAEYKWPASSGGSGSVVGPATSTNNAVPRFNGTDGSTLKNSPVTIDDSGNVATPGTVDGRDVSTDGATLDSHVANMNNPHNTTKAQVGLGNVENAAASTLYISLTQKGAANGVATLDAGGLIPSAQLPPIAITDTFVVASQAAQTALTAQVGDVAVRTDLNKSYILRVDPASTFTNWQELLTPTDSVLSVNGQTGVVNLTKTDVGLGNVDNTSDATKNTATATLTNKTISGTNNTFSNIPAATALTGAVPIANGGTGQTLKAPAFNALSPIGAKGDLIVGTAANTAGTQAIGTDLTVLTADSTTGTGMKWAPIPASGLTPVAVSVTGTSVANTIEEVDATGGLTRTLPVTTAAVTIGFIDALENCSTTNFIRITPGGTDTIDNLGAGNSLVMDYVRANVVLYKAAGATSWKVQYQNTTVYNLATSASPGLISKEDSGTFSATFSGPFSVNQTVTIQYYRVGPQVTLRVPVIAAAANPSPVTAANASVVIPVALRPLSNINGISPVISNGVDQAGYYTIGANGSIAFFATVNQTGTFSTTGSNGWENSCFTYLIV